MWHPRTSRQPALASFTGLVSSRIGLGKGGGSRKKREEGESVACLFRACIGEQHFRFRDPQTVSRRCCACLTLLTRGPFQLAFSALAQALAPKRGSWHVQVGSETAIVGRCVSSLQIGPVAGQLVSRVAAKSKSPELSVGYGKYGGSANTHPML